MIRSQAPGRPDRTGSALVAAVLRMAALVPLLLLATAAGSFRAGAQGQGPNVVVILADDLGAHDPGFGGSRFHETPNLDRLAREGVRFTQAYSACTVCSPTRAALMTGKAPARLKITDWIAGHARPKAKLSPPADWVKALPLAETTLAERARSNGLATLHIGKWHLGGEGFGPLEQGFDTNLGGDHRGQPPSYFVPYGLPQLKDGPKEEYLTDREGREAAAFIRSRAGKPFFLNVAFHGVHTPLQAPEKLVRKYRRKAAKLGGAQTNAVYAAMLESLDTAVGRILKALEETGQAGNTLVVFTSDNGGLVLGAEPPTSNAPLRSGKGSPYEGGVRVPLLVRWPGVTTPGTTCNEPVVTMDVAATIAAALGSPLPPATSDGLDLSPLLRQTTATLPRPGIFWHYPHYHPGGATPYAAVRSGDWKLIQYYEDGHHELFRLSQDPRERTNLATLQPEKTLELARLLFDWQGRVGAQWPLANPDHVPDPAHHADNTDILLHSRTAQVHGSVLRYEPMPFKDTLGWWARVEDWADWKIELIAAGLYEIELTQGCGRGSGGAEVDLVVNGRTVPFVVEETGHFQNFIVRRLGQVDLVKGRNTIEVRPRTKPGGAVMDLRQIRLVPADFGRRLTEAGRDVLHAKRIAVLGDSITYGGEWLELAEAVVRRHHNVRCPRFFNLGLPSETVSGLSEEGHAGGAFPRPDLNERLQRVLEKVRPDLIVACYGMNDGIYFPLSEERFAKFRDGMRRLHETAAKAGVRVIHLTPPVFDPVPLAGKTLPAGLDRYPQPFEGYDSVLAAYGDWLLSQRKVGWEVVDIHGPMRRFLDEARRADPSFRLSGDGVHANGQGHWLMAREFVRSLGFAEEEDLGPLPGPGLSESGPLGQIRVLQRLEKDAWLTHVGHKRPGMSAGRPMAEVETEALKIRSALAR